MPKKFIVLFIMVMALIIAGSTIELDNGNVTTFKQENLDTSVDVSDTFMIRNSEYKGGVIALGIHSFDETVEGGTAASDVTPHIRVQIIKCLHSLSDSMGRDTSVLFTPIDTDTGLSVLSGGEAASKVDSVYWDTLHPSVFQYYIVNLYNVKIDSSSDDSIGVKMYLFKEPR